MLCAFSTFAKKNIVVSMAVAGWINEGAIYSFPISFLSFSLFSSLSLPFFCLALNLTLLKFKETSS